MSHHNEIIKYIKYIGWLITRPCANDGSTRVWGVSDVFKHPILKIGLKKTEKMKIRFPALWWDIQDIVFFHNW